MQGIPADQDHIALNQLFEDAKLAWKSGDADRAKDLYHHGLKEIAQNLGQDHFGIGVCLQNLGDIYYSQGDLENAAEAYARLLAFARAVFSRNEPALVPILFRLAIVYDKLGAYNEAESLYVESETLGRKVLPADDELRSRIHRAHRDMISRITVGGSTEQPEKIRFVTVGSVREAKNDQIEPSVEPEQQDIVAEVQNSSEIPEALFADEEVSDGDQSTEESVIASEENSEKNDIEKQYDTIPFEAIVITGPDQSLFEYQAASDKVVDVQLEIPEPEIHQITSVDDGFEHVFSYVPELGVDNRRVHEDTKKLNQDDEVQKLRGRGGSARKDLLYADEKKSDKVHFEKFSSASGNELTSAQAKPDMIKNDNTDESRNVTNVDKSRRSNQQVFGLLHAVVVLFRFLILALILVVSFALCVGPSRLIDLGKFLQHQTFIKVAKPGR